ncbi:FxsA family protein [Helicobacter mustelae]|uniref:Uncharacterized protein n=1 Tax=Helicobacter mustelae (strain ATCC 43772 / CCUG 25715 / CIP 103759 / LMG 18044 / NCTC 12198 / R85-136P) TaxID=679897 RepID=D3UJ41_HELM1|nr:FxsA family protein [Helicobacter mustelae]CBG40516.1 Putative hypothetical protein [Helicobacter mustelae 12198]SQH72014.1 phage T7 F exclusion suppressor FxsA [Helicobacter mustelae]STP13157.1 phage T7 F exclusion suppressor FxsA [Helicobacter mustelae]
MKVIKSFLWVYLILEILAMVYMSDRIGFMWAFVEVIVSACIGTLVLLNTKMGILEALNGLSAPQIDPSNFVRGNFAKVFGALLLILPGVLSDILGLVLLINAYFILRSKPRDFHKNQSQKDEIIDVEVEEAGERYEQTK